MRSAFVSFALVSALSCSSPGVLSPRSSTPGGAPAARRAALDRPPPSGGAPAAPLLTIMKDELARVGAELRRKADPVPYFIAYQVSDTRTVSATGEYGALVESDDDRVRGLDTEVRVGDSKVDNTHPLREDDPFASFMRRMNARRLPLDDEPAAIRTALWLATEEQYRAAAERLVKVRAAKAIHVRREDESDDFSKEPVASYREPPAAIEVDLAAWKARTKEYSALFKEHGHVHQAAVSFQATAETRYFVSSEGSEIQLPRTHARLLIQASTTADDGMELARHEAIDAPTPQQLADDAEIRRRIQSVITDLDAMRKAPVADPFVGPAILDGRAAGVMFHEIFGHRVEGHRQKDDEEGQTFAKKVGQQVMPSFIDVYDDPTARSLGNTFLNGFYRHDDEGVPAQRALLVDNGVLRGFLMSRSPTRGFNRSNGHGRRQSGHPIVARQGNLVVDPARPVPTAELKRLLIEEVTRQKLAYGLRFREVDGGFTMTMRAMPQAFKVLPVVVYRVYRDGREEMIRGADIEGTPLASLSKILSAGDDFAVFNGFCGAESGMVPVSAVSPSLLVAQVEIARRDKGRDKPPILPAPPMGAPR